MQLAALLLRLAGSFFGNNQQLPDAAFLQHCIKESSNALGGGVEVIELGMIQRCSTGDFQHAVQYPLALQRPGVGDIRRHAAGAGGDRRQLSLCTSGMQDDRFQFARHLANCTFTRLDACTERITFGVHVAAKQIERLVVFLPHIEHAASSLQVAANLTDGQLCQALRGVVAG